jgi:hypothetical protein
LLTFILIRQSGFITYFGILALFHFLVLVKEIINSLWQDRDKIG